MKQISDDNKDAILTCIENRKSDRDIASTKLTSRSMIQNVCKKYRPDIELNKPGHPRKLSPQNKRFLVNAITSGSLDTAVEANKLLKTSLNVSVSNETVGRALVEAGLKASEEIKKPLISKKNIKERYASAKAHKSWTTADWERVIWSDETKIDRFCSGGKSWCWKKT